MDRRAFYDRRAPLRLKESRRYYHRLLQKYFSFLVTPQRRVLEVGCGLGDLLAATKPAFGVGVDFSPATLDLAAKRHPGLHFELGEAGVFTHPGRFDYILLSDLVNDLDDVQQLLERLQAVSSEGTRLILNFFNNLWRPILYTAEKLGRKAPTSQQNWLSLDDMKLQQPRSGNPHWGIVGDDHKDHDHKDPKDKDNDHKEHN